MPVLESSLLFLHTDLHVVVFKKEIGRKNTLRQKGYASYSGEIADEGLHILSQMTMAVRRGRGFFQMSLTLTLRGVAAFITPPHGAHPMLRRSSALHWTAPQSRISSSVKQSLGLVLLLGSTATGYALQLRRPKDECGVLCASASVSDTQVVWHRIGSTNNLPGGLVTTEHFFSVPLKHEDPSSPRIEVFVRELGLVKKTNLPGLVFLQGGPGFQAGRPMSAESGWVKRALESHRVFLLDQRGTGRSTCVLRLRPVFARACLM